jgi:hypothetical protein
VNISGLKGDNYANALMKCVTKAKRRVTLSIVGLGMLDESELDTIKNKERFDPSSPKEEKNTPQANQETKELPYKMTKLDNEIIEMISGLTDRFKNKEKFDEIKKQLKFQTSKDIYILEDSKKNIFLRELKLLKDTFEREQVINEANITTDDLPF